MTSSARSFAGEPPRQHQSIDHRPRRRRRCHVPLPHLRESRHSWRRRLPEFKFWYSLTKAFVIAFCMTFFSVCVRPGMWGGWVAVMRGGGICPLTCGPLPARSFNIPVFWPILLMYFIALFFLTMKRQIKHMIKYKYVPFSFGKTRRGGPSVCGCRGLPPCANCAFRSCVAGQVPGEGRRFKREVELTLFSFVARIGSRRAGMRAAQSANACCGCPAGCRTDEPRIAASDRQHLISSRTYARTRPLGSPGRSDMPSAERGRRGEQQQG